MASTGGFKSSPLPPIAETGMRGFLKWLQREQPGLYQQLAARIAAQYPSVFSDYNQSLTAGVRQAAGAVSLARRLSQRAPSTLGILIGAGEMGPFPRELKRYGVGGFGQNDASVTDQSYFDLLQSAPDPAVVSNFVTPQIETNFAAPTLDVADAANQTAGTTTPDATAITNLVTGAAQAYMGLQQAQVLKTITNVQLQRAQSGLAPLNVGMTANGIPTVSASALAAGGGTLLLLGGAVLLFLMMGRGRSARG